MKNKAASAIVEVVLMVAITVAIAATVYVYVSGTPEKDYIYITGTFNGMSKDSILLNDTWYRIFDFQEDNFVSILGKNMTFIFSEIESGWDYKYEGILLPEN